jgi:hypothetical protein
MNNTDTNITLTKAQAAALLALIETASTRDSDGHCALCCHATSHTEECPLSRIAPIANARRALRAGINRAQRRS